MRLPPRGAGLAILLATLALAVAEPATSVVGAGGLASTSYVVQGELVSLIAEDFDSGRWTELHAIHTSAGSLVEVDLSRIRNAPELVGSQVSLSGTQTSSGFEATHASVSSLATTASLTAAHDTAVILFNFTNDASQPWTRSFVAETVFGLTSSVAAYFRDSSYGTVSLTGSVSGWVTIPFDNSGCLYGDWGREALKASGIDPDDYAHVVYAFPRTYDCTWAGLSTVGGKYSWINGFMTVRTVGHELAHEMGVHHASSLRCTAGGSRVTLSDTCTRSEYGDPFSIMGTGTRLLHNWHRAQIGWLPEVQTVTTSGYYLVAPIPLLLQPRLLRIPRGDGTYLNLEYRQPFGAYDNFPLTAPAVNGVTVRIAPDKPTRTQSLLLDMTPATETFEDAGLAAGRSFVDPVSGVKITTAAVLLAAASIRIELPGSPITPSPTPSPTVSPTSTSTPQPSQTAAASPTPSSTPQATVSPSPSQPPAPTPTPPPATTLTAPGGLTAVRLDGRNVRLSWQASSGGAVGYKIFRNRNYLGSTTSLRYFDRLRRDRTARYVVRAVDRWGRLGPRSAVAWVYAINK